VQFPEVHFLKFLQVMEACGAKKSGGIKNHNCMCESRRGWAGGKNKKFLTETVKKEEGNEYKTEKCIVGCRFVSFGAGDGDLSG
jgi:hypothetical protein